MEGKNRTGALQIVKKINVKKLRKLQTNMRDNNYIN